MEEYLNQKPNKYKTKPHGIFLIAKKTLNFFYDTPTPIKEIDNTNYYKRDCHRKIYAFEPTMIGKPKETLIFNKNCYASIRKINILTFNNPEEPVLWLRNAFDKEKPIKGCDHYFIKYPRHHSEPLIFAWTSISNSSALLHYDEYLIEYHYSIPKLWFIKNPTPQNHNNYDFNLPDFKPNPLDFITEPYDKNPDKINEFIGWNLPINWKIKKLPSSSLHLVPSVRSI